jgi:ABC-type multidrug transport system ATPase subunit
VLGFDSVRQRDELKRRIGVQLQAGAYFSYLTLVEILELFGSFYPRRREPEELLARSGCWRSAGLRCVISPAARRAVSRSLPR